MKIKIILGIVMLLLFLNVRSQNHTPMTYVDMYDNTSIELMKEYGIPASIMLGISMLESGYGTSKLSTKNNNYFGVKKGNKYRSYESDIESFKDFCIIISKKKFYESLKYNIDYNIWLNKIRLSGYSTSSDWSKKVLYYIKKYKLDDLDKKTEDNKQNESENYLPIEMIYCKKLQIINF